MSTLIVWFTAIALYAAMIVSLVLSYSISERRALGPHDLLFRCKYWPSCTMEAFKTGVAVPQILAALAMFDGAILALFNFSKPAFIVLTVIPVAWFFLNLLMSWWDDYKLEIAVTRWHG